MDTKKLRQKILDLAIHGKLVPQDPNDEPASVLLERIRAEKERLISEGKIKRSKKSATSDTPHYENVPFEIPEGWSWCTLDDLCTIINGNTVDKSLEKEEGQIAYLRVGDMNLDENKVEIVKSKTYLDNPSNIVPINSFIFPKRGGAILTNKKRKVKQCPIWIDLNLMAVNVILPDLFEYIFLHFSSIDLGSICNGGNIPQINTNDIAKIFIPLPPILEQYRIVAAIEQWMSFVDSIESCTTDLLQSVQFTKSKILDLAIHGKLVPQDPNDEPASELLKRINPKAVASCDNPHYGNIPSGWILLKGKYLFDSMKSTKPTGKFFKYIDIDSIDNRRGVVTTPKLLDSNNAPSRASRYTCQGDVLFSMVRPYLRNIAIVPENNCIASTGFFVCHPIPVMTAEFCYYLMKSSYIVDGLNQFMKGDNSPSINNANITEWIYPIPPIEEQNRIVTKIKELYGNIDSITEALL